MSMLTHARQIPCPYCGETIEILIDGSQEQQQYIEDCSVCCQPINFAVAVEDEDIRLELTP